MRGKPWFRHKTIGYGVTPMSWQGWLCVLVLIVAAELGLFWLFARTRTAPDPSLD